EPARARRLTSIRATLRQEALTDRWEKEHLVCRRTWSLRRLGGIGKVPRRRAGAAKPACT
ncbi:MAG: hypothetical protein MUQ30_01865, partial [Anaerolineae bacterium]|nr:hypothetical protein [Anaerolineae bacterium]